MCMGGWRVYGYVQTINNGDKSIFDYSIAKRIKRGKMNSSDVTLIISFCLFVCLFVFGGGIRRGDLKE